GSTTTFSGSNIAIFTGFNITAGATTYVHAILDVKSSATPDDTVAVEINSATDVTSGAVVNATAWPLQLGASTITLGVTITVASSTAQAPYVAISVANNTMGSASIVRSTGSGQVTAVILKENSGTVDGANDLSNVELWLSSDDIWDSDDNQLSTAQSFDGADGECTFTETFDVNTTPQYLFVRLDITATPSVNETIELQIKNITTTDELSGLPTDISGTSYVWSNRKRLTFNNSAQSEDLTDFPAMIKLTTSRIDYDDVDKIDGTDIRFVDENHTAELSYEIEAWNNTSDSFIWVKVPRINGSSATDFIYMYYGNPGAADVQDAAGVWSNDYQAVYHFAETVGDYIDSTGNQNATTANVNSRITAGKIGYGPEFVEASEHNVIVPDTTGSPLDIASSLTMEAWVQDDAGGTDERSGWIVKEDAYYFCHGDPAATASDYQRVQIKVSGASHKHITNITIGDTNWHYWIATYDDAANEMKVYKDGGTPYIAEETNGPIDTNDNSLYFGSYYDYVGYYFDGRMDEVRISNVTRTDDWIVAQYKSMMDDSFIVWPILTSISVYASGTPTAPPTEIEKGNTNNCLGTFLFDGAGSITALNLTEYGTTDAANDLENVKLFKDDGDGNWEPASDTTQLGSTTTFSGSNIAVFSSFTLTAGATAYVHAILDVKSSATPGYTVAIEINADT
ncbi:MAG: DUF2341 domain-containing protein, partial [Deltaproteobacteria bacterium]|nr:DUF2341 domain-containing protein [Deltaproteobacteria bacterium]